MRLHRTLLLIALCLFSVESSALDISGVVRDSVSRDPIPGARVALTQDSSVRVTTDANGQFHFDNSNTPVQQPVLLASKRNDAERSAVYNIKGQGLGPVIGGIPNSTGVVLVKHFSGAAMHISRMVILDGDQSAQSAQHGGHAQSAALVKRSALPTLTITKVGFARRLYPPSTEIVAGLVLGLLPDSSELLNSIDTIISDMTATAHEGQPHGIVADWSVHPRLGWGITPRTDWLAFTHWGQIYEALEGNPAVNARINIRNLKAYMLFKSDNAWHQIQWTVGADGASYREDFANDQNIPAVIRNEADGSISATVGNGYNFHFWPSQGRVTIDPLNIAAVFTTYQARLIPDDFSKMDDRSSARIVADVGGDYWRSITAPWAADWSNNGDYAIGKFKYVKKQWRCLNAWAGDSAYIRAHCPPLD